MITSKEMRDISARLGSVHAPQYALREDGKRLHLELSELRDAYEEVTSSLRERAERAEAELRLVKDHDAGRCAKSLTRIIGETEAALARVRALCDAKHYATGVPPVVIRAAIEGDNK